MEKDHNAHVRRRSIKAVIGLFVLAGVVFSCKDDPQPVNEEELITTLIVDLTPNGGGEPLEVKFYDEDGDGSIEPVITPAVLELTAGKVYTAEITLLNETVSPKEDITEEVEEEKNDHLFCFSVVDTDVTISYDDEDDYGHPVGLVTEWEAGEAGSTGKALIMLRHQPGVKNGECPGGGDTDIQVELSVQVVN